MEKIQIRVYSNEEGPKIKVQRKIRVKVKPKVYYHLFVNGRTRSPVVIASEDRRVSQPGARFIARYVSRDNAYRDSACIRRDSRNAAEIARGYLQRGAVMRAERHGDMDTARKLAAEATPIRIRR